MAPSPRLCVQAALLAVVFQMFNAMPTHERAAMAPAAIQEWVLVAAGVCGGRPLYLQTQQALTSSTVSPSSGNSAGTLRKDASSSKSGEAPLTANPVQGLVLHTRLDSDVAGANAPTSKVLLVEPRLSTPDERLMAAHLLSSRSSNKRKRSDHDTGADAARSVKSVRNRGTGLVAGSRVCSDSDVQRNSFPQRCWIFIQKHGVQAPCGSPVDPTRGAGVGGRDECCAHISRVRCAC